MPTKDAYRQEVIDPGDKVSRLAHAINVASYNNCKAVKVIPHQPGNFRGPVGFVWDYDVLDRMVEFADDPVVTMEVENDGAGGKPQFFTLLGTSEVFQGLGWEIIAMTADDFARTGRFPAVLANELNCKRITSQNLPLVEATLNGLGKALGEAGLVSITGETAVMKHSITAFCDTGDDNQFVLTWGGTCIGLADRNALIDPARIEPEMDVIGFWEPGYRCNGGTFFTNLILHKWGDPKFASFWKNAEMLEFVKKLTVPSKSYARFVCDLVGWTPRGVHRNVPLDRPDIRGIAHITGGGVWGKFGEILPSGVGAILDQMPAPAEVLLEAQRLSRGTPYELTDWQAYSTFHGGCGMLLVCTERSTAQVLERAKIVGIKAQVVGRTTYDAGREVIIASRFSSRQLLSSSNPE